MSEWECPECGQENEETDPECIACEFKKPQEVDYLRIHHTCAPFLFVCIARNTKERDGAEIYKTRLHFLQVDPRYEGYKVGVIEELEDIAGKNKLRLCTIDIGAEEPIKVVTNAPNVRKASRVVVATVGATVKIDGESVVVKKTVVGGKPSSGMLCDSGMLGWSGGAAKTAAIVPESFAVGSAPPSERPRMDKQ